MEKRFKFLIKKPIIMEFTIGILCFLINNYVWASPCNQLKNLEIRPLLENKVELLLEFSGPVLDFKNFSVEAPPTIVFDFPLVSNHLSKDLCNQSIGVGALKSVNVVEGSSRTRLVIELQNKVGYEKKIHNNTLSVILEGGVEFKNIKGISSRCKEEYHILAFDFRRGEHGEGRIVVDLSSSTAAVNFKENGLRLQADFINAHIANRLIKRFDVTDFGTPVKSVVFSKRGLDVDLSIETHGEYDKIAYQMDNQFIIEVRSINKAEKRIQKELMGQYTGERISLNFQDIEIRALLQIIADFSKFNVITSDNVKGNVTLRLQNIPWDQALDIILKTKGLDKRQYGNVMMVGPSAEIAAKEKIELEGRKQIEELGPLRSELIQVNYAKAKDLSTLMKDKSNSIMTSRGNVTVDERTNTLLVQDTAGKLVEIRALIKKLDVAIRQVEIATQIVTIDSTVEETLGMRFGGGANLGFGHRRMGVGSTIDRARPIADFTNPLGQSTVPPSNTNIGVAPAVVSTATSTTVVQPQTQPPNANITQQPFNTIGPTVNNTEGLFSDLGAITAGTVFGSTGAQVGKLGLALGRLPNGTLLDLELQALEFESKSKTIAKPKLITLDQNKASVEKGIDIPYLQASSSGATSVAYKTAALKLEVTPQITPDDKINLDLMISNDTQGQIVAAGPEIDTNRLQTKVLADNGETIILGGILQIVDNKQSSKIPFFGDLPIVGGLFRNKFTHYQPSELIIFLTPRILVPTKEEDIIGAGRARVTEKCEDPFRTPCPCYPCEIVEPCGSSASEVLLCPNG